MKIQRPHLNYAEFGINASYLLPNYEPADIPADKLDHGQSGPERADRDGWARTVARLEEAAGHESTGLDANLSACLADEDAARYLMEKLRWGGKTVCPHCAAEGVSRRLNTSSGRPGLWRCAACKSQFTVTVATGLSSTHIPLHNWVYAIHMLCSSRRGLTAGNISRELRISHKSAVAVLKRLSAVGALSPVGRKEESFENGPQARRNRRYTLRPFTTVDVCRRLVRYSSTKDESSPAPH